MKISRPFLALVGLGLTLVQTATTRADEDPFVPRQAIIQLAPGVLVGDIHASFGTSTIDTIQAIGLFLVSVPPTLDEEDLVNSLIADPRVTQASLNYLGEDTTGGGSTQSIFLRSTSGSYNDQPALNSIRLAEASVLLTPRTITVAVLDTGLDVLHPAIIGRVAPGGRDFISNSGSLDDIAAGIDSNGNGIPDQFAGHGTHIAGIIARVAPGARILPLRVMDSDGQAALFDIVDAIYYAVDNNASIINLSFGLPGGPELLRTAINHAQANDRLVVAAAGNDGSSSPIRFPASWPGPALLSVAAVTADGIAAPFTNHGPSISISAPGVNVASCVPSGDFAVATGTSFAAAVVSGVAAALRAGCLDLSAPETSALVLSAARDIDPINPGFEGKLGAGTIDLYAASVRPGCTRLCPADFAGGPDSTPDGGIDISDLLAYLDAWSASSPASDLDDGSGTGTLDRGTTIDDLLYFLVRFENGC